MHPKTSIRSISLAIFLLSTWSAHIFFASATIGGFDLADRDAPKNLDTLDIARNISSLHVVGAHLLRFGNDWWTGRAIVDLVEPSSATAASISELDLSEAGPSQDGCNEYSRWGSAVYLHGDSGFAYVPHYREQWSESGSRSELTLYIVDYRNPSSISIAGSVAVDPIAVSRSESRWGYFGEILVAGDALLVARVEERYSKSGEANRRHSYDVYSLNEPGAPTFATNFEVPAELASAGWGHGPIGSGVDMAWGWWYPGARSTNVFVSGSVVASSHAVPVDDTGARVRYYLDRLDVSDPQQPQLLDEVNIPGQLAYYDDAKDLAVTIEDAAPVVVKNSDWDQCTWRGSRATIVDGACHIYHRLLNTLRVGDTTAELVSRVDLDGARISRHVAVSEGHVFTIADDAAPYDWTEPTPIDRYIHSYRINEGHEIQELDPVFLSEAANSWFSWPQLAARSSRAFLTDSNVLHVVTAEGSTPTVEAHEMPGWSCQSLQATDDRAFCAMGQSGVLAIDL
ncbi:MAG: hypothetical protein AAF355_07285 [Myxococcota bacterium]